MRGFHCGGTGESGPNQICIAPCCLAALARFLLEDMQDVHGRWEPHGIHIPVSVPVKIINYLKHARAQSM